MLHPSTPKEYVVMAGHAILLLIGLILGWVAGSRFTKAARGWRDYRAHKALLPGLRTLALVLSRNAMLVVALAIVVGAFALYVLGNEPGS